MRKHLLAQLKVVLISTSARFRLGPCMMSIFPNDKGHVRTAARRGKRLSESDHLIEKECRIDRH